MMLTDLLFMALVQQDLERAPERIRHSEALVKNWFENGSSASCRRAIKFIALLSRESIASGVC